MRAAGGCLFRNPERAMQGAATPVRRCAFFRADFDIKSAADVLCEGFSTFQPIYEALGRRKARA